MKKKGELDLVTVKAEPLPEVDQEAYPKLRRKLENAIKDALAIKMPVEFVPFGTLPRYGVKPKMWVDLRITDK